MSSNLPEKISAATRSHFEAQLALWSELNNKTFESVAKLVDLNMHAIRDSFEESKAVTQEIISATNPQEFFSVTSSHSQPGIEKVISYARQVADITSDVRAELSKVAQGQIIETNQQVARLFEEIAKDAPDGSQALAGMMKSAFDNASAGYERLLKTAQDTTDQLAANIVSASGQISHDGDKPTSRTRK